jgi:hypothetical protein
MQVVNNSNSPIQTRSMVNLRHDIYRMSQEEKSVYWEVIASVILKKKCLCTCVLFRPVSVREIFHCTVPKLLIRKIFYFLFLMPVFFCSSDKVGTLYRAYYIFENSTVNINTLCNSCEDLVWCSSVQCTVYCTVK